MSPEANPFAVLSLVVAPAIMTNASPEWFAGTTSHSIDASREMWAFFREHPLREQKAAAGRP